MYGCCVSYEMPVPVAERRWSHWYGPSTEPPWHEPTLPQLRRCCTERLMSMPLPWRAILMRSPRAETEPCAQQEPQYLRARRAWARKGKVIGRCVGGRQCKLPRNQSRMGERVQNLLGNVLVARHGEQVLVAPRERVGEVLGLQVLVRQRRERVVAAPNDASLLSGGPVPDLVDAAGLEVGRHRKSKSVGKVELRVARRAKERVSGAAAERKAGRRLLRARTIVAKK